MIRCHLVIAAARIDDRKKKNNDPSSMNMLLVGGGVVIINNNTIVTMVLFIYKHYGDEMRLPAVPKLRHSIVAQFNFEFVKSGFESETCPIYHY